MRYHQLNGFNPLDFQPHAKAPVDITSRVLMPPMDILNRGWCMQIVADPKEFRCGDVVVYERHRYRVTSTENFYDGSRETGSRKEKINLIVARIN